MTALSCSPERPWGVRFGPSFSEGRPSSPRKEVPAITAAAAAVEVVVAAPVLGGGTVKLRKRCRILRGRNDNAVRGVGPLPASFIVAVVVVVFAIVIVVVVVQEPFLRSRPPIAIES